MLNYSLLCKDCYTIMTKIDSDSDRKNREIFARWICPDCNREAVYLIKRGIIWLGLEYIKPVYMSAVCEKCGADFYRQLGETRLCCNDCLATPMWFFDCKFPPHDGQIIPVSIAEGFRIMNACEH